MRTIFDIRRSNKSGIESKEQFIVTRGDFVYLRIIGEKLNYEIMTATADEDGRNIRSYKNRKKLIEVARKTHENIARRESVEPGPYANVKPDCVGREFVKICAVHYISDAYRIAEEFFEIFDQQDENDSLPPISSEGTLLT